MSDPPVDTGRPEEDDQRMDQALVAERRALLDEGNRLRAEAQRLTRAGDRQGAKALRDELSVLRKRYRALLPEITVARCPFSGDLVNWPIDTVDLDGWFWNHDAPTRRLPDVPRSWVAMTGAMRLAERVTPAPFPAWPGPGVPYVVPRILQAPDMVAVISQIPVGEHTGWPITYFGTLPEPRMKLEDLWGDTYHPIFDNDGAYRGWDETTPWPPHYDYDLAPWLDAGKVLWIAPGDDAHTLRRGTDGCPYLGLTGPRGLTFVEDGKVRHHYPENPS